jgi:ethanolamine transporter EutH
MISPICGEGNVPLEVLMALIPIMEVVLIASGLLAILVAVMSARLLLLRDTSRLWRYAGAILGTSMGATVVFVAMMASPTLTIVPLSLFYGFYLGSVLITLAVVKQLRTHEIEAFLP